MSIYNRLYTTHYSTCVHTDKYLPYDRSRTKFGFQSIEKRIGAIFNELGFDLSYNMAYDFIRYL